MNRIALLVILTLVAGSFAGCIENMRDLKDRVGGSDEPVQPAAQKDAVTPTPTKDDVPVVNRTTKPPVARIGIYGAGGALVFQSSFIGEDGKSPIFLEPKTGVTFNAAESAAIETGAKIEKYTWSFAGKTFEGRQASAEMPEEPGLYPVSLVVVDSHGKSDTQNVTLGIDAKPFDVVTELVTGQVVGVTVEDQHQGESVTVDFAIEETIDGKAVTTKAVKVTTDPGDTCDVILEVLAPDGTSLGSVDKNGPTTLRNDETLAFEHLMPGAYKVRISPYNCADTDGVPVTVVATYVQVIAGMEGGAHAH